MMLIVDVLPPRTRWSLQHFIQIQTCSSYQSASRPMFPSMLWCCWLKGIRSIMCHLSPKVLTLLICYPRDVS